MSLIHSNLTIYLNFQPEKSNQGKDRLSISETWHNERSTVQSHGQLHDSRARHATECDLPNACDWRPLGAHETTDKWVFENFDEVLIVILFISTSLQQI